MDINCYRLKHNLIGKSLISAEKLSQGDLMEILVTAKSLKTKLHFGERAAELTGANVLVFTKHSLGKSRISLELAAKSLGANTVTLSLGGSDIEEMIASPESIKVMCRFGITAAVVDTDEENDAAVLADNLTIPVLNANDKSSPCQALSVLFTLWEKYGTVKNLKFAVIGEAEKCRQLIFSAAKCGLDLTVISPNKTDADEQIIEYARQFTEISYTSNLTNGINLVDAIFVGSHDFGSEYKLTEESISKNKAPMIFHNIPFERDKQISNELLNSENLSAYDQAENMMHVERASIYLMATKFN